MALNLPEKICVCGCGESFKPKRRGQRFKDKLHRFRYHNRNITTCPKCGHVFEREKAGRV